MNDSVKVRPRYNWNWRHLAALLTGNFALALGPWAVRLADTGPVSAGFWRLMLALPAFVLLARFNRQPLTGFARGTLLAIMGAGLFFALDLASWHIGIGETRLANATLFGNAASFILMLGGLIAMRRTPRRGEMFAVLAALSGAAILFGRSLEMDVATLAGDLLCLLAGLFYAFYLVLLQGQRAALGNWTLLFWSSVTGAPVLLAMALVLNEPFWPQDWWPLLALAFGSQIFGQGLLVYSLRHVPPMLIGITLLTQPAVAIVAGWYVFNETLTLWDGIGMALVATALVMARVGEKPASA